MILLSSSLTVDIKRPFPHLYQQQATPLPRIEEMRSQILLLADIVRFPSVYVESSQDATTVKLDILS